MVIEVFTTTLRVRVVVGGQIAICVGGSCCRRAGRHVRTVWQSRRGCWRSRNWISTLLGDISGDGQGVGGAAILLLILVIVSSPRRRCSPLVSVSAHRCLWRRAGVRNVVGGSKM